MRANCLRWFDNMDTRNKMEAVKVFVGKEDIDRNRYRDKDRRRILMNEI